MLEYSCNDERRSIIEDSCDLTQLESYNIRCKFYLLDNLSPPRKKDEIYQNKEITLKPTTTPKL